MSTQFATVSNVPYFGRAWKLELITSGGQVLTAGSQSFNVNDESLKVTFETSVTAKFPKSDYAFADISIYNLNQATQQTLLSGTRPLGGNDVIQQANIVTLFAGYQNNFQGSSLPVTLTKFGYQPDGTVPTTSSSLIWAGQVFQPLWERVNVTDYKVTLHCLVGFWQDTQNFVNDSIGVECTQSQIVQKIAQAATNGISIEDITDLENATGTVQLPRGAVLFGRPGDLIGEIAQTNYMSYYVSQNGINVINLLDNDNAQPQYVFGPPWPGYLTVSPKYPAQYTPTLLGTPQQTQDGVVFRVLMDSRLRLADTVGLDLSALNQIPNYPDPSGYPAFLTQNQTFIICGIRHVGDTRGEDWYTEVTAVSKSFWPVYSQLNKALPSTN